jgi:hypothetical protein
MEKENLTNEQKLEYVFEVIQAQEERRKRKVFWKWAKRGLIIAVLLFLYSNPVWIQKQIEKTMSIIMETAIQRVMEIQKEQMKEKTDELSESASRILDSLTQ